MAKDRITARGEPDPNKCYRSVCYNTVNFTAAKRRDAAVVKGFCSVECAWWCGFIVPPEVRERFLNTGPKVAIRK